MIRDIEDELVDLVIDLKCIESSNNYDEMLHNLGTGNKLYKELYDIRERDKQKIDSNNYNEDLLHTEVCAFYCNKLEQEIMTLLKGNI